MWDQAKQLASQRLKALNTTLAGVVGQQQLRQAELLRLEHQVGNNNILLPDLGRIHSRAFKVLQLEGI